MSLNSPLSQSSFIDGEANSIYSFNTFIEKLFARDYFRHRRYISEQNQQKFL